MTAHARAVQVVGLERTSSSPAETRSHAEKSRMAFLPERPPPNEREHTPRSMGVVKQFDACGAWVQFRLVLYE